MWKVYWSALTSALWVLSYINGQKELGDIHSGCPQNSYRHGNFCYVALPIFVKYKEAEAFCEIGGGLLAQVKDKDTLNFLNKLRIRKFLHSYWFGLKYDSMEWMNSDHTPMSNFSKWQTGQPNNYTYFGRFQECARMDMAESLEWENAYCTNKLLYVCEYHGENCTDHLPTYGHYCYELSKTAASYDDAEFACQKKGGRLAAIKNEATFNFLKTIIYAERFWLNMNEKEMDSIIPDDGGPLAWTTTTWIGIQFLNGNWTFSDGSPLVFTHWAHGQPKDVRNEEDCVTLGQFWHHEKCDLRYKFVCQYPANADCKSPRSNVNFTSRVKNFIIKGSFTAQLFNRDN